MGVGTYDRIDADVGLPALSALGSTDLHTLSVYLKTRLGGVPVRDYVGKALPRRRIDQYIARLAEFVGSEPETPTAAGSGGQVDRVDPLEVIAVVPGDAAVNAADARPQEVYRSGDEPTEVTRAIGLMNDGSTWTALATLRRDLDDRIANSLSTRRPIRMEEILARYGGDVAGRYVEFRNVANRAIHGEDVGRLEAQAAVRAAIDVYRAVARQPDPPFETGPVFVEAKPTGATEGSPIAGYVVQDAKGSVLATFDAQSEAVAWAGGSGRQVLVARVRQLNDKTVPDYWRSVAMRAPYDGRSD